MTKRFHEAPWRQKSIDFIYNGSFEKTDIFPFTEILERPNYASSILQILVLSQMLAQEQKVGIYCTSVISATFTG